MHPKGASLQISSFFCPLSTERHSTGSLDGSVRQPLGVTRRLKSWGEGLEGACLGVSGSVKHRPSLTDFNQHARGRRGRRRARGRGKPAVRVSLSAHQNVSWGSGQEFRPVGVLPMNPGPWFPLIFSTDRPSPDAIQPRSPDASSAISQQRL